MNPSSETAKTNIEMHCGKNLPAICNVAFLETAMPAVLLASHQYTPESCSRLFCSTLIERNE